MERLLLLHHLKTCSRVFVTTSSLLTIAVYTGYHYVILQSIGYEKVVRENYPGAVSMTANLVVGRIITLEARKEGQAYDSLHKTAKV